MKSIRKEGPWFKDEKGRTLLLRGVNLGGSSKVPFTPDGATHKREEFFNHREVSFIGRPFPLDEADEHFARLRSWGFTFLRLLTTWEAIEHPGPGQYDLGYLEYLRKIVEKAGDYGITVFIDPHQDVWSRFSGGDGAPGWSFEAVGLDITKFKDTGAAIVHQTHGDPFPRMIWPTNGGKFAAATMFTLFFGGNDFAPKTTVNGEPFQEYLQRHYIEAMVQVAIALEGCANVVGYDTMNEPLPGYIGCADMSSPGGLIRSGLSPSPLQAMALAAGIPQEVGVWKLGIRGERQVNAEVVNPDGVRAWLPGFDPIWRQNGVWEVDSKGYPIILKPHHFVSIHGREIDFDRDYYKPFQLRFASAIHTIDPDAFIFIEVEPRRMPTKWEQDELENIIFAPHWYDGFVLYMKDFKSYLAADFRKGRLLLGARKIRRSFQSQLAAFKTAAHEKLGDAPTLIGEFGIAYDMRGGRAYRDGNYDAQLRAMNRSFVAMEDNMLSCTLWNYTADNTNERGDKWNGEDLSIFSRDQQTEPEDINSGGRALEAAVRPYPLAVAGKPLHMSFNIKTKEFKFEFRHDPAVHAPTEIFVPRLQYPDGISVDISDGTYEVDNEGQRLLYHHERELEIHNLRFNPKATRRK